MLEIGVPYYIFTCFMCLITGYVVGLTETYREKVKRRQ